MTDEQKEMLKNIGVLEEDYEGYYISENNLIFTPIKDRNSEILKSGEDVYNTEYLSPLASSPTQLDVLKQQLLEMQGMIADMQYNILLNGGM